MVARETDVAVGDMDGFLDESGGVLFDGFKDDFHVVDDVVSGDDDGFIEVIIFVFLEEKADVFGLVSWETGFVYENTSVKAVAFAFEDKGAVGFFVNLGVGLDGFEAETRNRGFGVVFFEFDAKFFVEVVEVFIA